MRNSLTGIALVGLLIAVPTVASAQAQPRQETTKESKDSKVARGDQHFMKEAAEGGMAEVQLGQLASQRASSDSVKQFGKRMADDHQKAADELKQLASQKGVALPTSLDRGHQRLYDRLSKLSGADFDRAYMKEMVKDHDRDVKAFRHEALVARRHDEQRDDTARQREYGADNQTGARRITPSVRAARRAGRRSSRP
ncbi:MAG: DUF4142 domain-containing protein [Candidatus Rokuibacteriota bacterium]|nr:MAG: DUF4142 domain-containing protein [Candidatus Rokubacteria bacterium]